MRGRSLLPTSAGLLINYDHVTSMTKTCLKNIWQKADDSVLNSKSGNWNIRVRTPVYVLFIPVLPWVNSSTSLGPILSSSNWRCQGFVGGVLPYVFYAAGGTNGY